MDIGRLYVLQLKGNGIDKETYAGLSALERSILFQNGSKYFLRPDARARIRVGLTGGVFDILHIGHLFTLSEARKHCDVLVTVVANDSFIGMKGRKPLHSQKYRGAMVESLKQVDAAMLGGKDFTKTIAKISPDVIIYGYDQKEFMKPPGVEIIKLTKHLDPKKFKSSRIIKRVGF